MGSAEIWVRLMNVPWPLSLWAREVMRETLVFTPNPLRERPRWRQRVYQITHLSSLPK